ncbi:myozenin-2 [Gadus chalcogrammus]|uniref:myozenin-2 n=1 Tax=Gadus chalcogrammus TaxID=1042646 RepID=UPI0024C4C6D7|nr:myozenin-2 [Gadus chalcogrammus]XP_056456473.1 myozenin-2 [Gadus chalcogrammus]
MLMMQRGPDEQTKHKMHLAKALCDEVRGGGLNRGQKSSAPLDVMLEELQLPTNRGSRMFQERQKRVEHFTLEHATNGSNTGNFGRVLPPQPAPEPQPGKENLLTPRVGKHSLILNLQKTIAKKGNPEVLAPGYSGPLRGVPCERFNSTVIPRSYSSPWREGEGDDQRTLATLTEQLPKPPEPSTFRCFNRSALPFGGPMTSRRVIPVMSCEALEAQSLPASSRNCMSRRPDFNRAPKGWGMDYCPESAEL